MLCRTGLLPNLKTSKNHFVTKIMCHFARKTICCAGNIVELRFSVAAICTIFCMLLPGAKSGGDSEIHLTLLVRDPELSSWS